MKDKYQSIEISILLTYLYKSLFLINGVNLLLSISKLNTLISIVGGFILGFIVLLIYLNINNILPKYNIFKKIDKLYKKVSSFIIKIILILSIILFTNYLFKVTISLIKFNYVDNLTIEIISIVYISSLLYLVIKGLKSIIRVSVVSIGIVLIFDIISILFSLTNINSSNLLPLITESFNKTIISSIDYIILTIIPIFLLLVIPKNSVENNISYNRYIKITYIILNIYIIFNITLLLSIININLVRIIPYPFIFILSKVNILNFFDRMENILSFKYLFDSFITLSLSIYYIKEGINSIFKNEKKYYIYIIGVFIYLFNLFFTIDIKYILIILVIFFMFNLTPFLKKIN